MAKKRRRKINYRNLTILIAVLVACIAITAVFISKLIHRGQRNDESETAAPAVTASAEPTNEMSLFITGDALLHESVYTDAQNEDGTFDFAKQLDLVTDIAENYDLEYYNQETLLGGTALGLSGYPSFNSPQEFGDYMVSKGFNLVSTANNHVCDLGEVGIEASRTYWDAQKDKGVIMQGSNVNQEQYDEIATGECNGITYAFLSYCSVTNAAAPYSYSVNYYTGHEQEMLDKVARAKSEADVVIVAMHWGTEYSHGVNEEQTTLAQQLVDAGADVIVGNHPHDIEPYQTINGKPVFYAMGNMISTQIDTDNQIGMMAAMDIKKEDDGSITISNVRAELIYTYEVGEYPALRTNVKTYPFSQLTDEILPGYQAIEAEYEGYVTALGESPEWGLE